MARARDARPVWPDAEFVAEECRKIRDSRNWPLWPVLPMKHVSERTAGGFRKIGWIESSSAEGGEVVLHLGLAPMFGEVGPALGEGKMEFPMIESMVLAGWVGD